VGLRRASSTRYLVGLVILTVGLLWPSTARADECEFPTARADECEFNPVTNSIVCRAHGGDQTATPGAEPVRNGKPAPRIYLYTATDPAVGDCWYVTATPGGLDFTDPNDEPLVLNVVANLPPCPGLGVVPTPAEIETRAWEIFRSFALALPDPALQPPAAGITGLPTFLSASTPDPITYSELLPDGRTLAVRAIVASIQIDWGDGFAATYRPDNARPYPDGTVTHTYVAKTCPPSYRETHPSGGNCHPNLEAYPVTATFLWTGEYAVGGPWTPLGTLTRTATVAYDVDEVQGVLQS
jgi:hypothetical protein